MKYAHFMDTAPIYQPNARAEDGMDQRSPWTVFCEYVVIPIGSVLVILLTLLGTMLLNR